jgi:hypothetical protein
MPGGDRTGPLGEGARTGRAAGYCAGYDRPGYDEWRPGRGRGRGRGRRHRENALTGADWRGGRRGWGRRRFAIDVTSHGQSAVTREEELGRLRADLQEVEARAERLRYRIEELTRQEHSENSDT